MLQKREEVGKGEEFCFIRSLRKLKAFRLRKQVEEGIKSVGRKRKSIKGIGSIHFQETESELLKEKDNSEDSSMKS